MFDAIFTSFQAALHSPQGVAEPLDFLLREMRARAVGLWRCRHDHLEQMGFRAVPDMPEIVQRDFAAATKSVLLTETGLGIVKAAVNGQPAIATVSGGAGLGQSAGWLERFEARQSLALPIFHEGAVVGVLASSLAREIRESDPEWQLLGKLAAALGPHITSSSP